MEHMELPQGYAIERYDIHSPWKLLLNGEMCHETSKYNKEGWYVFLGEEGDNHHITRFGCMINILHGHNILLQEQLRVAKEALQHLKDMTKNPYYSELIISDAGRGVEVNSPAYVLNATDVLTVVDAALEQIGE